MAAVIARPGATVTEVELIEFCRDRLPGFKAPKRIHFRNSLPISAANKILKRDLKAEYAPGPTQADGYLPPRGGRVRNPRSFLP